MNVQYKLKIGQDEFLMSFDVKDAKDFFNQVAFYSSLPKTAPNGATDLQLVVRETSKGTYYSLVSESEKMEFQLGQHKEGGTMYAKDWVPLYQKEQASTATAAPVRTAAPVATPIQAPVQAPIQTQQAPAPIAMPQFIAPVQPQQTAPVQTAPTQAAAPAAPANPAVQKVANDVLSRFGIKK